MTSSPLRSGDPCASLPAPSTAPSSPTSAPSLPVASLGQLISQVRQGERQILQSVRSLLEPVTAPAMSFADMKAFEADRDCIYLGWVAGEIWYLPNRIARSSVEAVLDMLASPDMDTAFIRAALYELWLTTRHEKMDPADRDAMLMIYVRRLAAYPEDAVRAVLLDLSHNQKFWPTWSEIETKFVNLIGWRAQMVMALRAYAQKRRQKT